MSQRYEVPVKITKPQIQKLKSGLGVQIKHGNYFEDDLPQMLTVLKPLFTKMKKNSNAGKGINITLNPDEIEASGIFDKIKGAVKWVKKNVIDTEPYQKVVRPALRQALDYMPNPYTREAMKTVGDVTKAFGTKTADSKTKLLSPQMIKGSEAAKARMAKVRAGKKGGSFRSH